MGTRKSGRHTHSRRSHRIPAYYDGRRQMRDSLRTTGQTEYKCPNCTFSSKVNVEKREIYCRRQKKWVIGKIIVCHFYRSRIPSLFY